MTKKLKASGVDVSKMDLEAGIYENTWISDDFTEGKPAHKKCYNDYQAQLRHL